MATKMTATLPAWISSVSLEYMRDMPQNATELADFLSYKTGDMEECGWVRMGTATINLDLDCVDIQSAQIAALNQKIKNIDAEAERNKAIIRDKISKLQALPSPEVK